MVSFPNRSPVTAPLPDRLLADIEQAGYYPAMVADVVATALVGAEVQAHLVHQETTFEHENLHRHITVLALARTSLVIVHVDDHVADPRPGAAGSSVAMATSESIPLSSIRGVTMTHVISDPEKYQPGSLGREVTLALGWGALSRVDLMPASCADPQCEADHGYEGTIAGDDISLRISADAEGADVLARAYEFAAALSHALERA